MKYVSEERLRQIANKTRRFYEITFLNHLANNECKELNPWLQIDEFLKSGYTGWCWILESGHIQATMARYGKDDGFVGASGFIVFDEHNITHVMPLPKPDFPKE